MFFWFQLYHLDGFVSSPEKSKKRKGGKVEKKGKGKKGGKVEKSGNGKGKKPSLSSQAVFDLDEVVVVSKGKSKSKPSPASKYIPNFFGE